MIRRATNKQTGFSLVELMIAITLGIIVTGAILSVFVSSLTANTSTVRMTRLNQDLRAVMSLITRDMRRAGHWSILPEVVQAASNGTLTLSGRSGTVTATSNSATTLNRIGPTLATGGYMLAYFPVGATKPLRATVTGFNAGTLNLTLLDTFPVNMLGPNTWTIINPFAVANPTAATPVGILAVNNNVDGDNATQDGCVMFRFDTPPAGARADGLVASPAEDYGFRLNHATETVQIRNGAANCGAPNGWLNLTDSATISITALSITDVTSPLTAGGFNMQVRELLITLTGALVSDPTVIRTIQETVKFRNNEVLNRPAV